MPYCNDKDRYRYISLKERRRGQKGDNKSKIRKRF